MPPDLAGAGATDGAGAGFEGAEYELDLLELLIEDELDRPPLEPPERPILPANEVVTRAVSAVATTAEATNLVSFTGTPGLKTLL